MFRATLGKAKHYRRGLVVVQVAVLMVVILGFAALAIDMGLLDNAKADLQTAADATAMAAASKLADYSAGDPIGLAKTTASAMLARNPLFGQTLVLNDDTDIVFGRAILSSGGAGYDFVPTEVSPDAVQITVRKSGDSTNGSLALYFAKIFGHNTADLLASATAMMVPRDIAIVADLSGSHTDDCEFRNYKLTDICLYDVWDALPGGKGEAVTNWSSSDFPGNSTQTAGPGWGHMKKFGWGTNPITTSYNPTADSGLVYLPKSVTWTNSTISAALYAQGYIKTEVDAIMGKANDGTTSYYDNRTAVALGLAQWNSGYAGGLWSKTGKSPGNSNTIIASTEMTWLVPLLGDSVSNSSSIWLAYVAYMRGTSSAMYSVNHSFQYRYGLKTMANYLLEKRPSYADTPELINTPTQPMQAVKDGVSHLVDILYELQTDDQLSLEIYGTTPYHEIDLTKDYNLVSDRLNDMSAGYYDSNTNMGGGMQKGIDELTSSRARPTAKKTMFLFTDGNANIDASGNFSESGGADYALDMAQAAADQGIRIYCVSVGADADQDQMAEIAEIGGGEHFHAGADMDEYTAQLQEILERLGGTRAVELIE